VWRFGKIALGTGHPTSRPAISRGRDVAELKKGSRVTGGDRDKLAEELKKRYEGGESIRLLAESSGPVVRLRAPHPQRVRCRRCAAEVARPGARPLPEG
jgi:hypothetical protein